MHTLFQKYIYSHLNPISHIPMILAFIALFLASIAPGYPWIDENSGHRGRESTTVPGEEEDLECRCGWKHDKNRDDL